MEIIQMVQAQQADFYQGVYKNEQFLLPHSQQNIVLPENAEFFITVLRREMPIKTVDETQTLEQQGALNFLTAVKNVKKENFTTEDIEAFESLERGDYKPAFEERLP